DKIKQAQLIYIQQLIREKDYFFEIGKIIEIDQQLSEIFKLLNYVIDEKIDWQLFEQQVMTGETMARIKNVDFKNHTVTVKFPDLIVDENIVKSKKEAKKSSSLSNTIILNYRQSIFKNANHFYQLSKSKNEKIEKIENNLDIILSKIKEKGIKKKLDTKPKRPIFWFEKYHFTITRDNLIVLGGKNAQQNDILAKNDFKFFFHADVHGGSGCTVNGEKISLFNSKNLND
ncbi:putative RNA-binding protein, partial [Pseudoloma neurophilia]